jgi:hypothetical protein
MDCNRCGKVIPKGQSVVRRLQTGRSSSGAAHVRSVNLCVKCLVEVEAEKRRNGSIRLWVVILAFLGGVGAVVYFYLNRP